MTFQFSRGLRPGFSIGTIVLAMVAPAAAQQRLALTSEYYGSIDTSNAATLRSTIHNRIKGHTRIAYGTGNWQYLEPADEHPTQPGYVLDFYRNESYLADGTFRGTNPGYQREHLWPQSMGFPSATDNSTGVGYYPRTDLHNLFIADGSFNNSRGNNYFANASATPLTEYPTVVNNGMGGGSGTYPGNSNWSSAGTTDWEVWSGRRGEAARGLFYMDVRYAGGTHPVTSTPEPDLILTDDLELVITRSDGVGYMGHLTTVVSWHAQDPVNEMELRRMEIVGHPQGNRNPFIDYPEWGDCIFGGDCSQVAPIHPQGLSATAGASNISLTWQPRMETDLAGYNVYRSTTSGGPYTKLNTVTLSPTNYIDSGVVVGTTYYYVVRAIDTDTNESRDSGEVSSTVGERTQFAQESFEAAEGTTYFVTPAFATQTTSKYFNRYTSGTKPAGLSVALVGVDGSYFIAGENMDADGTAEPVLPANGIFTITIAPIVVTNYTDIEVTLALNALASDVYDNMSLGTGDYLQVFATIDSETEQLIGQFTKMTGGTNSNGRLGQDLDFDGIGDVEIADYTQLSDYIFAMAGEGDSMTIRIVARFEAGGEEIVFDNVRVSGVPTSVAGVQGWMMLAE